MENEEIFSQLGEGDLAEIQEVPTAEKCAELYGRYEAILDKLLPEEESRQLSAQIQLTAGGIREMYQAFFLPLSRKLEKAEEVEKGDVLMAMTCADRALNWLRKRQDDVTSSAGGGTKQSQYTDALLALRAVKKVSREEDADVMVARWYVNQPYLGAKKTVQLLEKVAALPEK